MGTYTTISGDEWDLICFKYYGNEGVIDKVMKENPEHINKVVFPAGIVLKMPEIKADEQTDKPPWMR